MKARPSSSAKKYFPAKTFASAGKLTPMSFGVKTFLTEIRNSIFPLLSPLPTMEILPLLLNWWLEIELIFSIASSPNLTVRGCGFMIKGFFSHTRIIRGNVNINKTNLKIC